MSSNRVARLPSEPIWATNSASNIYTNEQGEVKGAIEQGPAFVRLVAFGAALASCVCLVFHVLNPVNVFHPVSYILHLYLGLFALTTMLFEANPEWIEQIGGANRYLELLVQHCGFLCNNAGRGLFYFFMGTLWLSFFESPANIMVLGVALALIFVGVLSFLMHYGIMPQHIAEKTLHHVEVLAGQNTKY